MVTFNQIGVRTSYEDAWFALQRDFADQDYALAALVIDKPWQDIELDPPKVEQIQNNQAIALFFSKDILRALPDGGDPNVWPHTGKPLTLFSEAYPLLKLLIEGFEAQTERRVLYVGYFFQGYPIWVDVPPKSERWPSEEKPGD